MQESRSILRSVGGKHIARILPVAIITCFPLIALSLHVQPGGLPSYSSILLNARCCVQVVNCCFGSSVLTLARFFLLPLWQLLLVFAGFWWLLLPAAGLCLLLLASACSCWLLPAPAGLCLLLLVSACCWIFFFGCYPGEARSCEKGCVCSFGPRSDLDRTSIGFRLIM